MAQPRVVLQIGVSPDMRDALQAEAFRRSKATGRSVTVADLVRDCVADRFGLATPTFNRGGHHRTRPNQAA